MIWRLEYENAHGDVARLDIQRGAATPVEIIEGTENPFLLSYELEDKSKKGFIMSSFADISIYETATFNIDDLKTLDETALSVKWYINSVLEWTGFVVPDFFSRTIGEPAIVNLAASDRLSSLEDATLDGLGEYVKLEDLAIACLAKTGLSLPLISTVDFKADNVTNVMDVFALSERLEDDKGKKISCFDVLRSILVLTHSTIRQRKGQWRIYNKIQHEAVAPTLTFDEVYQGAKRTIQPVFSSVGAFQEFGGIKIYPKNNTFSNSAAGWVAENGFVTEFDNRELNYTSPDLPPTFGEETNKINLINRNIWIPGSFDTAKKLSSPPFKVPFRGADRVAFTLEINASAAPNQRFRYALIKRVNGVPVSFMRNDDTWLQGPGSGSYSGSWSFFPRQKDGEPYSSVDAIFTINANVSLEESEDPEKVTLTVHILGVDSYAPAGVQTLVSAIRSMTVKFDEKNDAKGILYRTDQLGNFSKKSDPNTTIFGDHISRGLNGYFYPYAEDDTSILRSPSGLNLPLYKWTTATDPTAGELPILQHVTRQMSRMFGVAHNVLSAVIDAKTFDPLAIVTNCAGEKYVIVAATFDFLRSTVEVELQQIAYGSLLRRDFIFSYFGGGDGDGISSIGSVSGGGSSGGSGGGIPQTLDLLVDELFISGGNSVDLGVYARKTWVETEATAFNSARLGGQLASAYTRRDVNEVITGGWSFNGNVTLRGDRNTLALYYNTDGVAKSRVNEIILGREPDFHKWRILNQSTLAHGNGPTLSFQHLGPTGSKYTDVLTMTYGRNVGIGIATPTEKLHVAGNGLFSGAVTAGGNVGTSNFASQLQGWRVTPTGVADFRHIYTDELQAKAFTADISQALVGSDVLTKSVAKLAQNWATTANGATSSIYVEELEGFPGLRVFAVGDKLLLRLFDRSGGGLLIKNIWATVASYVSTTKNVQRYTITVNSGGATGHTVYAGSMILDYGTSGSGVIERTVLDAMGSPYSQVKTWVNDPSNPDNYTIHNRTGNLDGIPNASGFGFYGENTFLTGKLLVGDLTKAGQFMEYKNGQLNIKGKITVTGGNAATKQDIDDLEIGGRNLIRETRDFTIDVARIAGWRNVGGFTISKEGDFYVASKEAYGLSGNPISSFYSSYVRCKKDETYTVSFEMKIDDYSKWDAKVPFIAEEHDVSKANRVAYTDVNITNPALIVPPINNGEWVKVVYTRKIVHADTEWFGLRFCLFRNGGISFRKVKMESGSKATDWTPAPEDVDAEILSAKQEALTAAGNAQSTANSANTAVGTLSGYVDGAFKDGVIDAAEAKAIEKYKNTLNEAMAKAESSYLKVYTNTYLSGTPKTALQNAKINLWGQRDTLIGAINTAIAGGTTTAAQKLAVDNAFTSFNSLMSAFQNALEEANKAIQVKLDDIAKGYTDAVQVGGRNLLKWTNTGANWFKTAFDIETLTFTRETTGTAELFIRLSRNTDLEKNTTYTLSAWVRTNGQVKDVDFYCYDKSVSNVHSKLGMDIGTEWQFITFTFTTNNADYSQSSIRFDNNGSKTAGVNAILYIKKPKLELGNKATDWTPAPEDVPSALEYLATAIEQVKGTTIEGGLVTTNLLMVKDTSGAFTGGMSGLSNDNVGFWTGGNYQGAISNNANVIFRKDGSFSLAGGKISGTSAGAATIEGGLITGMIESSNYNGTVGSRFDLHNGHLVIGDAIWMSGDTSEIHVVDRDTGLDSFRIGDFQLTPTDFAGAGVDVLLSNESITASPVSGSYQLNRTVYISSSGALMTSTSYISNSLIVGGIYSFQASLKVTLSQYYQLINTIPGYLLKEGCTFIRGNGIKVQLKNYNTVIWEKRVTVIPDDGVVPLLISTSFQATSWDLQLIITIDGEYEYRVHNGADTKIYNTTASIERSNSASRLVLQALLSRMEMSTRGMQAVFSAAQYFRCDSDEIRARGDQTYISPNGRYQLRVSNDGIEKSTNYGVDGSWTPI